MICQECGHTGIIGDSYGVSCSKCGTLLEGLNENGCKHKWEKGECIYCGKVEGKKVIYDIIWKKVGKDKTTWERIGIMIEKNGKKYIKIDMIPIYNWDGWLIASERESKEPF